jgi:folate-binding protein YgfZ
VGLPVRSEPMTATRIEWNGMDLRIARDMARRLRIMCFGFRRRSLASCGSFCTRRGYAGGLRGAGGVPDCGGDSAYGVDMAERDLPQETSQMRAIHFSKGCYLGQEIVERIRSRGNVHKHLRQLELDGPVPAAGTELIAEGGAAGGHITSAAELGIEFRARVFALGMMRAEAEVRDEPFAYGAGLAAGTARLLAAPPSFQ